MKVTYLQKYPPEDEKESISLEEYMKLHKAWMEQVNNLFRAEWANGWGQAIAPGQFVNAR